jgi:D-tyrosyl-tRNA(Tyr) deacylase
VKALIQRVSEARVVVDDAVVGAIGRGLLLYLGCATGDTGAIAAALAERVLTFRVFADETGRMGKSLLDIGGELLVVSQFTLAADVQKGRRPDFSPAMAPGDARVLVEYFCAQCTERVTVATGRFGADMQVHSVNDGPVTFLLEEPKVARNAALL